MDPPQGLRFHFPSGVITEAAIDEAPTDLAIVHLDSPFGLPCPSNTHVTSLLLASTVYRDYSAAQGVADEVRLRPKVKLAHQVGGTQGYAVQCRNVPG